MSKTINVTLGLIFLTNCMSNPVAWKVLAARISEHTDLSREKIETVLYTFYDWLVKQQPTY